MGKKEDITLSRVSEGENERRNNVDTASLDSRFGQASGTLLDYDYREVKVTQAVLRSARNTILVADATKFERAAPVRVAHLREVGTLVCDVSPGESACRMVKEAGPQLIIASDAQFETGA